MHRHLAQLIAGAWILLAPPVAAAPAVTAATPAYRTGAPLAYTGGFGEPHCGACHFRTGNDARGQAVIRAPASYRPGDVHQITVVIEHPDLRAAGFQLAVRFADGDAAGRQAGRLEALDADVAVDTGPGEVRYAGHTEEGTALAGRGVARWTLRWTAPDAAGTVVFHAAVNAADGDDSEFGDHILLARHLSYPAQEK
jgi:hypothetical protein